MIFMESYLLKKDFALAFKQCDEVVLCPVYSAGEKVKFNFSQENFSKMIAEQSNVQVINIIDQIDLKKYILKNLLQDEIVICMGAGSISSWIRNIGDELK